MAEDVIEDVMFWLVLSNTRGKPRKASESLKRLALWNCLSKNNSWGGRDPSTFECDFGGAFFTSNPVQLVLSWIVQARHPRGTPPKTWFPRQVQEAIRKSIVSSALRRWMFQNWHWHCLLSSILNPNNLSGPLPKHCTRSHIDAWARAGRALNGWDCCDYYRSISQSEVLYYLIILFALFPEECSARRPHF